MKSSGSCWLFERHSSGSPVELASMHGQSIFANVFPGAHFVMRQSTVAASSVVMSCQEATGRCCVPSIAAIANLLCRYLSVPNLHDPTSIQSPFAYLKHTQHRYGRCSSCGNDIGARRKHPSQGSRERGRGMGYPASRSSEQSLALHHHRFARHQRAPLRIQLSLPREVQRDLSQPEDQLGCASESMLPSRACHPSPGRYRGLRFADHAREAKGEVQEVPTQKAIAFRWYGRRSQRQVVQDRSSVLEGCRIDRTCANRANAGRRTLEEITRLRMWMRLCDVCLCSTVGGALWLRQSLSYQ
jgi:hypothetical protein